MEIELFGLFNNTPTLRLAGITLVSGLLIYFFAYVLLRHTFFAAVRSIGVGDHIPPKAFITVFAFSLIVSLSIMLLVGMQFRVACFWAATNIPLVFSFVPQFEAYHRELER